MAINKAKTSIKDKVNRIKSKYVKGEIEPKATALSKTYAKKEATLTKYKRGGRTIAQTPAPKSDRIYGSKKNIKGSASTEGSNIKLSKKTVEVLKQKLKEFKEKHPNADNITLSDLEKIYRRGSGAYSKSHRPTITGGVPNTRAAWSFARVNKFLEKAAGHKVKKAYVQDDDLLKYADGGLTHSLEMAMTNLKKNGIVLKDDGITVIAYNKGNHERKPSLYSKKVIYSAVQPIKVANTIIEKIDEGDYEDFDESKIEEYKKYHLIIVNQNEVVYDNGNSDIRYEDGGEVLFNPKRPKKKYLSSDCGTFAYAFHDLHGGDYLGLFNKGQFVHVVIQTPSKKLIDASGETSLIDLEKRYGVNLIPKILTEKELENIYGTRDMYENIEDADDRYSDIPTAKRWIKSQMKVVGLITPNGNKSNLTPEQYKLVRTPAFKAWFGDWEKDPQHSSKVVDASGKPLPVYHSGDNKFNEFDINKAKQGFHGKGFYFSKENLEYGENVYKCYLNIRKPFNINDDFSVSEIKSILKDKYHNIEGFIKEESEGSYNGKVGGYIFYSFAGNDLIKEAGYDGIFHHNIYVAFNPQQIKLADGSNTTFDASNPDIRYEDGGNLKYNNMKKTIIALPDTYSSEERLKDILKEQGYDIVKSYEHGGEVQPDDKKTKNMITHKSGSAGGMLVGNRHSEGGIKAINKSTDTPLEMEGGEVVITRNAVSDSKKREFEGEMLTNRQILSRINESGGGVSFAKGGDIPHKCSCSGKSYAYGGKTMTDYEIIDDIHNDYNSRMFGVQHLDKSNSECCELLFVPTEQYEKSVHLYSEGGMIRLVHKKVPSYKSFAHAHTDISGVAMKKSYKMKLKNEYDVDFDKLPQNIKVALLIGNQKLVDNYLNS